MIIAKSNQRRISWGLIYSEAETRIIHPTKKSLKIGCGMKNIRPNELFSIKHDIPAPILGYGTNPPVHNFFNR